MTRRGAQILLSGLCALTVSGCGLWHSTSETLNDTQLAYGTVGYADRCFDTAKRAFPSATFQITDRRNTADIATNTVVIQLRRIDVKPPTEASAQCRYDRTILTDFHWLKNPLTGN